jgi:hypothetical protein
VNPLYPQVSARALHRCEYCLAPEIIFNLAFEVEHIVPVIKGGQTDLSNLALACRSCNLYKGATLEATDPVTREKAKLFHPRNDSWQDHFRVHETNGVIEALTPVARVTLMVLKMNSRGQLEARQQWMRLGVYP